MQAQLDNGPRGGIAAQGVNQVHERIASVVLVKVLVNL
jgi:hypothetical protein